MSTARWKKSSFSGNNGTCVEIAAIRDRIATRDSKNSGGPILIFPPASFRCLIRGQAGTPPTRLPPNALGSSSVS